MTSHPLALRYDVAAKRKRWSFPEKAPTEQGGFYFITRIKYIVKTKGDVSGSIVGLVHRLNLWLDFIIWF